MQEESGLLMCISSNSFRALELVIVSSLDIEVEGGGGAQYLLCMADSG